MLDIKYIRENQQAVARAIEQKHLSDRISITKILELDSLYISLLKNVELHRNLRNQYSTDISKLTGKDREKMIEQAKGVKEELGELEAKMEKAKSELDSLLLLIPNVIAPDVPEGVDESENVVLRSWGIPRQFSFTPKDHLELGEKLGVIDVEQAAAVSGSRFCYLKGGAALLQFALVQFVFHTLSNPLIIGEIADSVGCSSKKPFIPVVPPVLIKPDVMKRMDRLDPLEERYYIPGDPLVLVGSAEHTMGPMYMDRSLDSSDLPLRYVGYSTAFRREAGSYGKDIRGIFRVHQFDKLEMESFASADHGDTEQKLIVGVQEYLLQKLGLPYQVMAICTGDMGKPDYRQVDLNVRLPAQAKYRELQTSDYMTDYQARRLNATYKDKKGDRRFLHMNDATALAIGRTIVAIFENYQNEDGSVTVPEVLRAFMPVDVIK